MRRIESLGILRPCWGKEGIATLALEKHQRSRQIQLFKQNSTQVNMPSFTQPKVPQTSTKNFNAYCVVM
ncbi:hypothetical protein VTI28DRAFT_3762 [Corynascus sepedonium]